MQKNIEQRIYFCVGVARTSDICICVRVRVRVRVPQPALELTSENRTQYAPELKLSDPLTSERGHQRELSEMLSLSLSLN